MSQLFLAVACAAGMLAPYVAGASYAVQPTSQSRFALTVEKTGLYRGKKHLFLFEKYEGQLEFDNAKPESSKIQFTIDSRSLVCKDDWVSESDLRKVLETASEDMLATERHPKMTFSSSSIRPLGGERYEASGTLTIRDTPKPVTVTVQLDATNPAALHLEGRAVVRLSDYKLKPPSALFGVIGTKNEMVLNFKIVATQIQ